MTIQRHDLGNSSHWAEPSNEGRVVLCGSMSAWHSMERIRCELSAYGVEAIAPTPDEIGDEDDMDVLLKIKRNGSRRHMSLIQDATTVAVLVVNIERSGALNYVGPNSFGELAVAFAEDRATFVLNEIPLKYKDELTAWGVRPLKGDLTPLIEYVRRSSPRSSPAGKENHSTALT